MPKLKREVSDTLFELYYRYTSRIYIEHNLEDVVRGVIKDPPYKEPHHDYVKVLADIRDTITEVLNDTGTDHGTR